MAKERIDVIGPGRMGPAMVKAAGDVPDWTGRGTDLS